MADRLFSTNHIVGFLAPNNYVSPKSGCSPSLLQNAVAAPRRRVTNSVHYDDRREKFKPGYEPDYSNPNKGNLPTFERSYNFQYSFDATLAKCGL